MKRKRDEQLQYLEKQGGTAKDAKSAKRKHLKDGFFPVFLAALAFLAVKK